jgi:pimeloyl-ACP methyl ester carboxylesterase
MIHFVLIHGSWHTGEHLIPVARQLELLGHRAEAPTLLGHGHGPDTNRNVSHGDIVRGVVEYFNERDLRNVVLVGHSFGGTIIARVAEEVPERLRRLVFWNAFVPKPGNRLMDELPPHYRTMLDGSGTGTTLLPWPVWRDVFINDADADLARAAYDSLVPEPARPSQEVFDLKRFYESSIPRSYLNCTEDIALPPGEWGWHPRMSSRLGVCRLVQMPGSHEVLFTNPSGLARKLVEAGRD